MSKVSASSMSGMKLLSAGVGSENPVIEAKHRACPQRVHSRNSASHHHNEILKTIRSKHSSLQKCKNLFFRVPYVVSSLSPIKHPLPTLHYFEIVADSGEVITISSSNQKILNRAKCGLIDSMKVMRSSMPQIKTPAQMLKEAGW